MRARPELAVALAVALAGCLPAARPDATTGASPEIGAYLTLMQRASTLRGESWHQLHKLLARKGISHV